MKLIYKGAYKFVMFPSHNLKVKDGMEIETDNKQEIKQLKELGFKEVKSKKEEGDN